VNNPARLAVFVSGGGTNLQALLDHFNARHSPIARVELVVASRPGVGALDRALGAGVAAHVVDPAAEPGDAAETELIDLLGEHEISVVVLAGYLKLVPPRVVTRFSGAMLNVHPALLPAFGGPGMYGLRVHQAVIASGARVTGATVHLVDERYDEGKIVAQWPVPVIAGDTPESLAARVLQVEHLLLPAAIEALVKKSASRQLHPWQAFELVDATGPTDESVRRLTR
jgi:phosphoribosylglycinamide formyltransferase-1